MRPCCILFACSLLAMSAVCPGLRAASSTPPDRVLLDFEGGFNPSSVPVTDAHTTIAEGSNGKAFQVTTGHKSDWPGITLKAPAGFWDLTPYGHVTVDLQNIGTNRVTVYCRVDNPGADGTEHCVTSSLTLELGQAGGLSVSLKRAADSRLAGKLFGMRGYPVGTGGPGTIDPARINQLMIFVSKPDADHAFKVDNIRATGSYTPPTAWVLDADPFFPFIDTFGQYKHKDWPGKVHSVAELKERAAAERKELDANPAPANWNRYGGWATGPLLQATGYFRTEKVKGKWWMVDPEGRLFFSQGIDCVRMRDVTPIEERETWFEGFPGLQPDLERFAVARAYALKGHYAGRSPRCYSFGEANIFRKYGPKGAAEYPSLIHQRLRSWGLNTIGMWSDERTCAMRRTPYADSIGSHSTRMIEGSEGYWGKFPDVWDPAFREGLRTAMSAKVGKSAGDPWCLGYFADNEMSWGDETSLALATLRSPTNQAAKRVFLEDLKAKYDAIANLNSAWGTEHTSWEALFENTTAPDRKKARADLEAFYSKTAEAYFRTVRGAIKERAPHQLYLGCRFAWVNARAAAAAARYCDVVSYNLYQREVSNFQFNGGADVPLIIGEFHFGALDRGLFHTGLVPVENQEARADAYRRYVEGALRHPNFVGCHWFQYQDEPTTGRVYDEENYQIGFVDVADTPYRETIAASRQVAEGMYSRRAGE